MTALWLWGFVLAEDNSLESGKDGAISLRTHQKLLLFLLKWLIICLVNFTPVKREISKIHRRIALGAHGHHVFIGTKPSHVSCQIYLEKCSHQLAPHAQLFLEFHLLNTQYLYLSVEYCSYFYIYKKIFILFQNYASLKIHTNTNQTINVPPALQVNLENYVITLWY